MGPLVAELHLGASSLERLLWGPPLNYLPPSSSHQCGSLLQKLNKIYRQGFDFKFRIINRIKSYFSFFNWFFLPRCLELALSMPWGLLHDDMCAQVAHIQLTINYCKELTRDRRSSNFLQTLQ